MSTYNNRGITRMAYSGRLIRLLHETIFNPTNVAVKIEVCNMLFVHGNMLR